MSARMLWSSLKISRHGDCRTRRAITKKTPGRMVGSSISPYALALVPVLGDRRARVAARHRA
jgi:hypothetical protein